MNARAVVLATLVAGMLGLIAFPPPMAGERQLADRLAGIGWSGLMVTLLLGQALTQRYHRRHVRPDEREREAGLWASNAAIGTAASIVVWRVVENGRVVPRNRPSRR